MARRWHEEGTTAARRWHGDGTTRHDDGPQQKPAHCNQPNRLLHSTCGPYRKPKGPSRPFVFGKTLPAVRRPIKQSQYSWSPNDTTGVGSTTKGRRRPDCSTRRRNGPQKNHQFSLLVTNRLTRTRVDDGTSTTAHPWVHGAVLCPGGYILRWDILLCIVTTARRLDSTRLS